MKKLLTIVSLISILFSCDVKVTMNDENKFNLGDHEIIVKPRGELGIITTVKENGVINAYEVMCGETKVRIYKKQLQVNNKIYRTLKDKEPIIIDHGKVYISNKIETVINK